MTEFSHKDVVRANQEYYRTVAEGYFDDPLIRGFYTEDLLSRARETILNVPVPTTERFLDFGCGQGTLSRLAEERFRFIVGIDVSETMLKYYQGRGIQGDGLALPFKNDTFDMVAFYGVLHHILDWKNVLKEIHRVTQPGGILYMDAEPNAEFYARFKRLIMMRRGFLRTVARHDQIKNLEEVAEYHQTQKLGFDLSEITTFLEATGYASVDVEFFTHNSLASKTFSTLIKFFSPTRKSYPYFRLTAKKL